MTDMTKMELNEFSDLLEIYGSLIADWPKEDFERAGHLLETSEAARTLLQETVAFEETLDSFRAPEPSAALRERILADADLALKGAGHLPSKERSRGLDLAGWLDRLFQPIAMPALATWLLMAALGVASGVALSGNQMSDEEVFAYYGGDTELWVDALALDDGLQNGSGT
jgi:hypothetical protein